MSESGRQHPSRERFHLRAHRFVSEYLKDLNGTQAVLRMGYTGNDPGQAASAFLRSELVKELLATRMGAMFEQAEIKQEAVLDEVASIAFCDPRAYFDEFGNLKPLQDLTRQQAAAIASIEVNEDIDEDSDGGKTSACRTTKIKFWPKMDALDKLGRYLKIWEAAKVNLNVDARSVTVHQHATSPGAVRAVDELIARTLTIGAPPGTAAPDPNGPVLPAAVRPEPGGHGTPMDARGNPGGADAP